MDGFDHNDPLNRITKEAAEDSGTRLVKQIDTFVRLALEKVVSPETLALFVDTRMAIPELDLNMTLLSPHSRSLEVRFKNKFVASVVFDTIIEKLEDQYVVTHKERDLLIA